MRQQAVQQQQQQRQRHNDSSSLNKESAQHLVSPMSFLSSDSHFIENSAGKNGSPMLPQTNSPMGSPMLAQTKSPTMTISSLRSSKNTFVNSQHQFIQLNQRNNTNGEDKNVDNFIGKSPAQQRRINGSRMQRPQNYQLREASFQTYDRSVRMVETTQDSSKVLQSSMEKPVRMELGKGGKKEVTAEISNNTIRHQPTINSRVMQHSMTNESMSYGQQQDDNDDYDDEIDHYEQSAVNQFVTIGYKPYHLARDGRTDKGMFNRAIQEQSQKEKAVIVGAPYYEKRCRNHRVKDDPNDINCTFMPQLFAPLGAPKDDSGLPVVDPLSFQPIQTAKHSAMTKSSIDYHYKRVAYARNGPQPYHAKPGGVGPFNQKVAVDGTKKTESRIESRKKQLSEGRKKAYYETIQESKDPSFNLVGGKFRGAKTVRANVHSIDLPYQEADKKRLRIKNSGQNDKIYDTDAQLYDSVILQNDIRSRTLDSRLSKQVRNSTIGIRNAVQNKINIFDTGRQDQSHLRRSIQTHRRKLPLNQLLNQGAYTKATITERYTNKGIRNRTQTRTEPLSMAQNPCREERSVFTRDNKSIMNSKLNHQSQLSQAFGASIVRNSIESAGGPNDKDFVIGVPKFVKSNTARMRYANDNQQLLENLDFSFYESSIIQQQNNQSPSHLDEITRMPHFQEQQHQPETRQQLHANKFQEEWYPDGIDSMRKNFLKSSIRNRAFDPNRTFQNETDQLIPMLFEQSIDSSLNQQKRKQTRGLKKMFNEHQFNVVDTNSKFKRQKTLSPGLSYNEQQFQVVSKSPKKKLSIPEKQNSPKKRKGSQESGLQGSIVDFQEGEGVKDGQDALNLDHGFFDFSNIPQFSHDKFDEVHAKYRRKLLNQNSQQTQQSDQSRKTSNIDGGEFASEQMAELAFQMLETDQRMENQANLKQEDDPVLNMNNLKDMPFSDFMILHKIFPKLFMLKIDSKSMQRQPSRSKLMNSGDTNQNAVDQIFDEKQKQEKKETLKLHKALTRRSRITQKHNSMTAESADGAGGLSNIIVVNALENTSTSIPPLKLQKKDKQQKNQNPHDLSIAEQESSLISQNISINEKNNEGSSQIFDDKRKEKALTQVPSKQDDRGIIEEDYDEYLDQDREYIQNQNALPICPIKKIATKKIKLVEKQPQKQHQKQLTMYEIYLQKYTNYLRSKKLDRCEKLMKQGSLLFRKKQCQHQFIFNQGVLYIAQQKFDDAVDMYLALYNEVCKDFDVRPSALRIEGTNEQETQKFSILQNLIIAYMMQEMQNPSRTNQKALYLLLKKEKLLNIRYTQSADELNLFKIATYVKQYIQGEQTKRYIDGITDDSKQQEPIEDNQVAGQDSDEVEQLDQLTESASAQIKFNIDETVLASFKDSTDNVIDDELESELQSVQQDQLQVEINYDQHFKKNKKMKGQKKRYLTHTFKKKIDILNETITEIQQSVATYDKDWKKFAKVSDENQTSTKSKPRQNEIQDRIKHVIDQVSKKSCSKTSALETKRLKLTAKGSIIQTTARDSSTVSNYEECLSPCGRIPISEADSIFDEVNPTIGTANSDRVDKIAIIKQKSLKTQEDESPQMRQTIKRQTTNVSMVGEEDDPFLESQMEQEAEELGIDLSALYSHKKPRDVQNVQKRLIVDILNKQNANHRREQKYRNMAINRIKWRKKHSEYKAVFGHGMQEVDERIAELQMVEVEMIKEGGGISNLDPLQQQYKALASSITKLCKEPDIADIVLKYLQQQNELNQARKNGLKPPKSNNAMETSYSAALEVIIHATSHIFDQDRVEINEEDRAYLIFRIKQVKEMFEEEFHNPELIAKTLT